MAHIIGIDFGTSNSSVAVFNAGQPHVIPDSYGSTTIPSVVAIKEDGTYSVGHAAKDQQILNPRQTVYSVKRLLGRLQKDAAPHTHDLPYTLSTDSHSRLTLRINKRTYWPQEIAAMLLAHLRKTAETYLGEKADTAVITVPAYYNESQRQATKEAAVIAGLTVARIINEPTAAAMLCRPNREEPFAVLHFGGGTFDVSFLDAGDAVLEVLATYGDTSLGGDDFDRVIYDYLLHQLSEHHNLTPTDCRSLSYIRRSAEEAKCQLSERSEVTVTLPGLAPNSTSPVEIPLPRGLFEASASVLFDKIRHVIRRARDDAKLGLLRNVMLVGGSSLIPRYRAIVAEELGVRGRLLPDFRESVCLGAAIQGAQLAGDEASRDSLLLDVTPLALGIETLGGVMTRLIDRNTIIPTSRMEVFSTAADNQTDVDIHVLQGDREFARDNKTIGRFQLADIPPAPRGIPQIQVTFEIDANGTLNVSAKDLSTGQAQSVVAQAGSKLSSDALDTMTQTISSSVTNIPGASRLPKGAEPNVGVSSASSKRKRSFFFFRRR